jgi:hypothetical protein
MTSALLDRALERSERVVGRRVAGEYILVPIVGRGADADSIYSLNAVAAFIWEHLDGHTTGHGLVEAVVEAFDVLPEQAREDYEAFVTQLSSLGALRARDSGTG